MIEDIVLANQWLLISWVGVLLVLVGAHFLTKRAATQAAIAGGKEASSAHSFLFGWIWTVFFVVTLIGAISVGVSQSINWAPRQTEDRSGADSDQQEFERRIEEKQQQE
jgi:hypothetical protein